MTYPIDPRGLHFFNTAADLVEGLPVWLSTARGSSGLSLADTAHAIGVSIPVVARVERGLHCQANSVVLILRWLGKP
jgi:ribosome-binding protein aMBF1 (putative translation factor)